MAISRILITGDFLRPHPHNPVEPETPRRNRWFEDLLAPPLARVTDLPVQSLECDGPMNLRSLYRTTGVEPSLEAWAALWASDLGAGIRDRILEASNGALVIGVELPPSVSRVLRDAGVPLLDCVPDPLRFLDDVPLAWRTTDTAMRAALEPFRLSAFDIERRAAQVRSKTRWMRPPDVPVGATLVLDQVPHDSALIDPQRGRLATWTDYLHRLADLKTAGPVLWRPHPHNRTSDAIAEILGHDTKTTANFYQLVSHDHLTRVAAMSSGGVVEARAFGKDGVHFLDRYAGIELPDWGTPVTVEGHWVSPHFWSAVLAPVIDTRRDVPVVPPERNFLRRSLNNDWGFGWIDQVVERQSQTDRERAATEDRLRRLESKMDALAAELDAVKRERDELAAARPFAHYLA